jgi:hypothetical protein
MSIACSLQWGEKDVTHLRYSWLAPAGTYERL